MPVVHRTVCPLDCPDRCALDVTVDGDRIVEIDGSHRSPLTAGYICAKVRRFDRRVDSPDRILHPMKRTGPKGNPNFERISWSEAIGIVASRFREILDREGSGAILPFSYSGSNGLLTAHAMDERFWNRLGGCRLLRTFCAANTGAGWRVVFDDLPGAEQLEVGEADAIVLWGVNPSVSSIHLVPPVRRAQERGAFLAVIDPRRTPLAKSADLHVPLLPGTDVAVAMAAIRECVEHQLYDADFVAKRTRGFAELAAASQEWTAERAAALARIDPASIGRLARELARRERIFFRVGWGLERNRNGSDAVRAVLSLRAILGKFGARGSGVALSTTPGYGMDFTKTERPDLRRAPARTFNMSELGRVLEETKNPPIRALYVYNCNPAATAPHQSRVTRALRDERLFTVVHDQVLTDTCAFADVVLPATTFLEHKELVRSYGSYALQWGEPVIAPRGEAKPNHEVFMALAAALGFDGPEFRASEEDLARSTLEHTRAAKVGFEELREKRFSPVEAPLQFGDVFPSRGFVDLAGKAPPRFRPSPADASLPLVLISPASDKAITSTLYELVPAGTAAITMNPADAAARGLAAGDRVRARNSQGSVEALLAVSEEIAPGVASLPKGLWRRHTLNGATANALAPDHVDELGGGACFNDARVEIEAATEAAPRRD